VGACDGLEEGVAEGTFDGCFDGLDEIELVGTGDGLADGDWLGFLEGDWLGLDEGCETITKRDETRNVSEDICVTN